MKISRYVALGLICILLTAVVFAPAPATSLWMRTLHDTAHGPIFGCVAVLTLFVLARSSRLHLPIRRQYLLAFAVAAVLGIATELAQGANGRDASFIDALRDLFGALAFLLLAALSDRRIPAAGTRRVLMLGVAVLSLAVLLAPLMHVSAKYYLRARRFPVLADFSRDRDVYLMAATGTHSSLIALPPPWSTCAGESALRVELRSPRHPGVSFDEPVPRWRGYSSLAIDITNPTSATLQLVLRVHDLQHNQQHADRFNKRLQLEAGTRRVFRIPLTQIESGPAGRRLDLDRIAAVVLFRSQPSSASEMYVSRLWLERSDTPAPSAPATAR